VNGDGVSPRRPGLQARRLADLKVRPPNPGAPASGLDAADLVVGATTIPVMAISLAGIVLVETQAFSPRAVMGVGVVLAGALGALLWRTMRGMSIARTDPRDWVALTSIVVVAVALCRPSAEAYAGGGDASVYLAAGRLIANDGGLGRIDATIRGLPPGAIPDLVDRPGRSGLSFFPGGMNADVSGRVRPDFFHLTPIWLAVFDGWFGPGAATAANGVFAVLSIAIVWALARRLSSRWGALAAGALLAVNFAQIWFARLPTSEMSTQYLVMGSLFWLLVASDRASSGAGVLAGLAAGLTMFARIDAFVFIAAPLMAATLLQTAAARRVTAERVWFAAVLIAMTAYAAWHAALFAGPYCERILVDFTTHHRLRVGSARMALIGSVVVALLWGLQQIVKPPRWLSQSALLAAGIGAAAWLAAQGPRVLDGHFLLLVSPLGLGMMAAGLIVLLRSPWATRALPLAALFLPSALVFLPNPRDTSGMPMLLRRFVPILLPIGVVIIAYAVARLSAMRAGRWLSALGVAALGALWLSTSAFVLIDPPFAGLRQAAASIAARIPPDALTIHDAGTPSHLALALHYEFDRSAILVSRRNARAAIERTVAAALEHHQPVRFLMRTESGESETVPRAAFGGLLVQPVAAMNFDYPAIDPAMPTLPGRVVLVTHRLGLYEVAPAPSGGMALPLRFDAGGLDFGWLLSGFHGPEQLDGVTARWTDGALKMTVPPIQLPEGFDIEIAVRLAIWRPAGAAAPTVTIDIDDARALAFATRAAGFDEYRATFSQEAAERLRGGTTVTLSSPTFVPAESGASGDRRRLGVAIDWMELRATAARPPSDSRAGR
jgi:hypothetical protein